MDDIKLVKLVTGEDIICQYSVEHGVAKIENPVQVSMVPSRTSNQPTFGFIPFPITSNEKILFIDSTHIMFVCEPAEEFVEQYRSLFSGIVTPTKKLILN